MTAAMNGVSGAQVAQPLAREQGAHPVDKPGASKFDAVLAEKAEATQPARDVQAPSRVEPTRHVEPVTAPEKAQRVDNLVTQVLGDLERGQARLEQLIQQSASGKQFSNAELLGLQASMYQYTQELDLTSKVVEKATSGLKDLTKTQV